ncbi:MAG: DUF5946 family protein [Acidimicrobiales bacterium]
MVLGVGEVRCLGCGVIVVDRPGPMHAYLLSAPGCWALYSSLEDWRANLFREQAVSTVHHLVDSYAAQHSAPPTRRDAPRACGRSRLRFGGADPRPGRPRLRPGGSGGH